MKSLFAVVVASHVGLRHPMVDFASLAFFADRALKSFRPQRARRTRSSLLIRVKNLFAVVVASLVGLRHPMVDFASLASFADRALKPFRPQRGRRTRSSLLIRVKSLFAVVVASFVGLRHPMVDFASLASFADRALKPFRSAKGAKNAKFAIDQGEEPVCGRRGFACRVASSDG